MTYPDVMALPTRPIVTVASNGLIGNYLIRVNDALYMSGLMKDSAERLAQRLRDEWHADAPAAREQEKRDA
jgi:RNA-binding protein YhbY